MDKTLTIICEEFKETLVNLINSSRLPICVVSLILENCLQEVKTLEKKQYEFDKKQYEESFVDLTKGDEHDEN